MSRIIEDAPIVEKRAVCHNGCGKTVGYVQNDVRTYKTYDHGGDCDIIEYIACPGCGKDITVGRR